MMKNVLTAVLFALCLGGSTLTVEAHGGRYQGPTKDVILVVCHPCTDCKFDVPVCVPCCCEGAPSVCFERTLLGAGRSIYEWPCGYRVVIRYTHNGSYRVVRS